MYIIYNTGTNPNTNIYETWLKIGSYHSCIHESSRCWNEKQIVLPVVEMVEDVTSVLVEVVVSGEVVVAVVVCVVIGTGVFVWTVVVAVVVSETDRKAIVKGLIDNTVHEFL